MTKIFRKHSKQVIKTLLVFIFILILGFSNAGFYILQGLGLGELAQNVSIKEARADVATYNFVGCGATCDTSTDWWASGDDVDLFPFGGDQLNRNTHVEATDAQYDLIESSNDSRWATVDPGAGDFLFFWNEMKIDQPASAVTQVDLTLEGALINGAASATGTIYVLKNGTAWETDANWVAVGTTFTITTTEATFTRSITGNFADYLGSNGLLTWGIFENQASTSLSVDYVSAVVTYNPYPLLTQNHYRWRDDSIALNTDGGWLAAQDTLYSPLRKNTTARLRVEIANTGGLTATNYNYRLGYAQRSGATCGDDETFVDVPVTATTQDWEMVTSSQYADGDDITASRLTTTGTFTNGEAVEDPSNQTPAHSLTNGNYTEFEYAIQATSNAVDSGTYCFRLTNAGSTTNFSYSLYPQVTLDIGGGRIWSSGFELQSVAADVEWTSANGSPTISTIIRRGGLAALQISSLTSAVQTRLNYQLKSVNSNGPFFARAYLSVKTLPSAENRFVSFRDSTNIDRAYITIDGGGSLRLYDQAGNIGTPSSALSLDKWYMIELKIDASGAGSTDIIEGKINGTVFATSSTRSLTNGPNQFVVGGNLGSESQTAGEWYLDDIAVNEKVGSSNNDYPGPGVIVYLRPNAPGDTATCTDSIFSTADESPPNDDTDYVDCQNDGQMAEFYLTDPGALGMRFSDTITLVSVGDRFRTTSGGTFDVRVKSTSGGTLKSSSTITPTSSYTTNSTSTPRLYPLTLYTKPEGGSWAPSNLVTTQVGVSTTGEPGAGANGIRHTALWLLVEYTPTNVTLDYQTQYNATHATIIPTGGSTSDGVTTNVYLDSYAVSSFTSDEFVYKLENKNVSTAFTNSETNASAVKVLYGAQLPSDRRSTCTVYDIANDQMVMFGGKDGETGLNLNDVWVLPLKEGYRAQWKKINPAGTSPQPNRAHVCVYDSLNSRLVAYGGYNGTPGPGTYLTDVYFLSLPSLGVPTWSKPIINGTPPTPAGKAPLQGHAVYDPTPSRMIVYGGYYDTDTDIDAVYELTLPSSGNPTWNNLGLNTGPSASGQGRDAGVMVYNPDFDNAILHGGDINGFTDEVWKLNLIAGSESWAPVTPGAPGGTPVARVLHSAVIQQNYSGSEDRMIIYGGLDAGSVRLDDVWELTLPASGDGTWTNKSPGTTKSPYPSYAGAPTGVYDKNRNAALIVTGFYDSSIFTNERPLAIKLNATGNFEYSAPQDLRNLKEAVAQMVVYGSVNKDIVMFTGARGTATYPFHDNRTWLFRVTDSVPNWRLANVDLAPIPRQDGSMVFDDIGDNRSVMCFGMAGTMPNYMNDCWELTYTATAQKWTLLNTASAPPTERWAAAQVYDKNDDRMVVFGGQGGSTNTYFNDVKVLSLGASPDWVSQGVSGTPPAVRRFASAVYDPVRDRMIVYGGEDLTGVIGTVYGNIYELTLPLTGNLTWRQMAPSGTAPVARARHVAVYDPDGWDGTPRMIVFGGADSSPKNESNFIPFNDVWELTVPPSGDGAWRQMTPSGIPPSARRKMAGVYDPENDHLVIMGGRDNTAFFSDTWIMDLNTQNGSWQKLLPDKKLPLTVPVTSLTNSTSYHWQSWITGSVSGDSPKAAYGGNSDTPPAGVDFTISTTTLPPTGDLTSVTFDTGVADPAYNSIVWKGTLPLNTRVRFRIAASDDSLGPGGSWDDLDFIGSDDGVICGQSYWYEPDSPGPNTPLELGCFPNFNNKRYFKYKVQLCSNSDCSTGGMQTPIVEDVIINWSP